MLIGKAKWVTIHESPRCLSVRIRQHSLADMDAAVFLLPKIGVFDDESFRSYYRRFGLDRLGLAGLSVRSPFFLLKQHESDLRPMLADFGRD